MNGNNTLFFFHKINKFCVIARHMFNGRGIILHFEAILPILLYWMDCFGGYFMLSRSLKSRNDVRISSLHV